MLKATFFASQQDFRLWLEKNHDSESELLLGYYKVGTGKPSLTWSESVDQALCFGWIDGVRRSIDAESYCIRFTPRKRDSIWSAINIQKVEQLTKAGLMTPAGELAFSFRKEDKSKVYSHESDAKSFDETNDAKFKKHAHAWEFFMNQAPSYRKQMIHWVMSAKQEKTKLTRLEKLILASKDQKRIQQ